MDTERTLAELDPFLRTVAKRHASRLAPAEDLLQEARIAVWQRLPSYDAGRGVPVPAWARVVAESAIKRYLANNAYLIRIPVWIWDKQQQEDLVAGSLDDPEHTERAGDADPMAESDSRMTIERLLAQLRPTQRSVMELDLLGYSNAEIAARLGLSVGTAKTLRWRAVAALRRLCA